MHKLGVFRQQTKDDLLFCDRLINHQDFINMNNFTNKRQLQVIMFIFVIIFFTVIFFPNVILNIISFVLSIENK